MQPRAIVLDVDGTLYHHAAVRRRVLRGLASAYALRPLAGARAVRAIGAYRRAQESMRGRAADPELARSQLAEAARASGVAVDEVAALVRRWMEEGPLEAMRAAAREGLAAFLEGARSRGVALGVLSDYPADAKLEALGVRARFQAVVCAQDPEVGRFKPSPEGLLHALARLGVEPGDALYVGDRAEIDGEVARRAGARFRLIGAGGAAGFGELGRECFEDRR